MIVQATAKLVESRSLSYGEAAAVMGEIMDGSPTPAQFGAFITALRMKGETVDELAAMAGVMRDRATRVEVPGETLVDSCGTGGYGKTTFNISTAAALVMAGAGAKVAKHGNRGITSKCGSADVLEALGVKIVLPPERVAACIREAGIGFMFAPAYHPAMKFAGPLRREIGIRTAFNILGPLTNPAGVKRQVLGVANPALVQTMASVLARMGVERALVVHGRAGIDEVSVSGPTLVAEVIDGKVESREISPSDFGIAEAPLQSLRGGGPTENAAAIREILDGGKGPRRDVTLLNAAAGLAAAGTAADIGPGLAPAAESIDSGAARAALEKLIAVSNAA